MHQLRLLCWPTGAACCLSSVYWSGASLGSRFADLKLLTVTCGKLEQTKIPLQWLSPLCCALQLLADAEFHDKKVCPEATASVLSLVTFAWVGRLMRAGYK